MRRNVEVKAKLSSFDEALLIATDLCKSNGVLLDQEDTFFRVPHGRLKLRRFGDGTSELISYSRLNIEGPKISDYSICKIDNSKDILKVLESALDVIGVIRKKRHLFIYNQTRIHLDRVENLGEFLELEVILNEEQNLEFGEIVANKLLEKFNISKSDLIKGAYIDL